MNVFFYWAFVICLGYLIALYGLTAFFVIASIFESLRRRTQAHAEDYDALVYSRFTIPVSVIVPAYNEQAGIIAVVKSLLDMDYPQHEVIVVNDGSKDATLQTLDSQFELQAIQIFYRTTFVTRHVRAVYRSKTDPRLLVIDKDNGGKADALNCGVNFARYRYLCCVDGDSVYTREALHAGMSLAVKDPANVLGVTSLVAVGRQPDVGDGVEVGAKTVDRHIWTNLQYLEILRAFVNNRLAWSRMGFMLCVSGAFGIWRRDVIQEVGGFSSAFTCEDIEMTFRVIEKYRREGRPGQILSLPDIVGITEGPERVSGLISQRARWQRVILETVWHYRRMFFNPRYGTVGVVGVPYMLLSECLGPFMQIFVVITFTIALVLGVLNWTEFLSLFGFQVFALGIMSTMSIWMNDWSFRYYRLPDLIRLILIAPLDLLWYRPILIYAHLKGVVQFLRRDKSWDRFERNVRHNATP
jgi:biofilm PGA synthesis N-glycosyltransferase PgaC